MQFTGSSQGHTPSWKQISKVLKYKILVTNN